MCFMEIGGPSEEHICKIYKNRIWFIDSGCSRHMTTQKENFSSLNKLDGGIS